MVMSDFDNNHPEKTNKNTPKCAISGDGSHTAGSKTFIRMFASCSAILYKIIIMEKITCYVIKKVM